jgi:hypothetical protein
LQPAKAKAPDTAHSPGSAGSSKTNVLKRQAGWSAAQIGLTNRSGAAFPDRNKLAGMRRVTSSIRDHSFKYFVDFPQDPRGQDIMVMRRVRRD